MDFSAALDLIAFLLVHVTVFELPLVLLGTVLLALGLARELDRHNARLREARLARRIALFYSGMLVFFFISRLILS